MQKWAKFFLGTPTRLVTTFVTIIVIGLIHWVFPGAISALLKGVIEEVKPLINYGIVLLFMFLAFRIMFGPFLGKGKGKS